MRRLVITTLMATASAVAIWSGVVRPARTLEASERAARAALVQEAAIRSADIDFWSRRAAEDPMSAEDRAMAAGLLLQRAREGGGMADYRAAETMARASLSLRRRSNGKAGLVHASALLAQHRFPEALAAAQELVAQAPEEPGYRALLAELLVEMGDYDGARVQFDSLRGHLASLAVAPRYARYLEFRGAGERAREILVEARARAGEDAHLPREQVAWFALRVADAYLRAGRLDVAERVIGEGLRDVPDDGRLWALAARVRAARGQWRDALEAIAHVGEAMDLQTRALGGDAWAATGDSAAARAWWEATEQQALENPEPFNRQWTMFRLEHGRSLAETRDLLEREVAIRTDVFGWGQLAWARLLTGDVAGAEEAVRRATAPGARDGWLSYVAGLVAEAAGDQAGATRAFREALEINPHFHHRLADDARRRLAGK